MAISTYAELQTAVGSWLHRSDLTSLIADFIALAESEINTELRMRVMETDATLSVTAGARTVALPTRFIDPIKLELIIAGQQNTDLIYQLPQDMLVNVAAGVATRPVYWTINGSNIEFPNVSDATYSLNFRYLKGFDIASESTNALLTKYPGLYLFGALIKSVQYTKDINSLPVWQSEYNKVLAKANTSEARARRINSLSTDLPSAGYSGNIFTG